MKVNEGYNQWAETYDAVENKTRDLDNGVTKKILDGIPIHHLLELGCGTGKNTEWLLQKASTVTAVDFSEEMLAKARVKIKNSNVNFVQADIQNKWPFENNFFDVATCNLILEHIENLHLIFSEAARVLKTNGYFFISELHPMKQYNGSKARFEINNETIQLPCFVHHASEFFNAAKANGFVCEAFDEWFDDDNNKEVPRLISFLFQKKN